MEPSSLQRTLFMSLVVFMLLTPSFILIHNTVIAPPAKKTQTNNQTQTQLVSSSVTFQQLGIHSKSTITGNGVFQKTINQPILTPTTEETMVIFHIRCKFTVSTLNQFPPIETFAVTIMFADVYLGGRKFITDFVDTISRETLIFSENFLTIPRNVTMQLTVESSIIEFSEGTFAIFEILPSSILEFQYVKSTTTDITPVPYRETTVTPYPELEDFSPAIVILTTIGLIPIISKKN